MHQNYRTAQLNEADLKLKALKQEERRKQQETAEMWRQFKKLEMGADEKLLASLKQQERRRVQETEHMLHTHQNNTIKESDMKLSVMRQEERKRMQEHEARLRRVNHFPGFATSEERDLRRSNSHGNLSGEEEGEETLIPKPQQTVVRKSMRRSSIGTVVSGDWKATTQSWRKSNETSKNPPTPAEDDQEADNSLPYAMPSWQKTKQKLNPEDADGNASFSSVQSLRSVFSKGNSTPATTTSLRNNFIRKDSATGSLVADPLDLSSRTLDHTPDPSERVELAEQEAFIESKTSPVKAAMSVFNKNTTTRVAPLLPPKQNTYVSSIKSVTTQHNETPPSQQQPIEKEHGNVEMATSMEQLQGMDIRDDPAAPIPVKSKEKEHDNAKATTPPPPVKLQKQEETDNAGPLTTQPPEHPKEKENDKPEPQAPIPPPGQPNQKSSPGQNAPLKLVAATLDDQPEKEETPVVKETPPEDIIGDELLSNPSNVVRLDVLFSFGLLTSSDKPVFTNYMDAVEKIAKKTVSTDDKINEFVWYDPVYPPFVQDYKTDGKSKRRWTWQ